MSESKWEKENRKKKEAMKKRLLSLGKDNPVVAKAIKQQEPPMEDKKWANWDVVDTLVSAARREYFDKEDANLQTCVSNLSRALAKLASKKPIDKVSGKMENDYTDED